MPRLPPSLFWKARSISPNLATLLPACQDLRSAQNELRWIRENVVASHRGPASSREHKIRELCVRRGRGGVPLQYVLGSQPFGHLDVLCRPGVLIPRPETEAYVYHLVERIRQQLLGPDGGGGVEEFGQQAGSGGAAATTRLATERDRQPQAPPPPSPLRVVDFCTGTGCIALLSFALLAPHFPHLHVAGFDVSRRAVALAMRNAALNRERGALTDAVVTEQQQGLGRHQTIAFEQVDIFSDEWRAHLPGRDALPSGDARGCAIDVLVSNPPYISAAGFQRDTARSVRNWEPKLALVPGRPTRDCGLEADVAPEDVFYARLLQIARLSGPRVMLFEVGDLVQATRVAAMAVQAYGKAASVEIWRDWPDMTPEADEAIQVDAGGAKVPVLGSGKGRAVAVWRVK